MSARPGIRAAQYGFTLAAVLALGYCAVVWVDARLYQAREARQFHGETHLKNRSSPPKVSTALSIPVEGDLVGRLEIPRIGVSVMVVEGTEDGDLKRAVGHIPGTALPGASSNVGIAGHRDTFFRPLRSIHRDDAITLRTLQGAFRYRVVSTKVVRPEDVQVLYPNGRDTLTLVTCFPFDYVGSAPMRFIVRAERSPQT